jgi:hypothetical protein
MTLSVTAFSITTLSTTTLSLVGLNVIIPSVVAPLEGLNFNNRLGQNGEVEDP